jgi:hypothetical protein
MLPAPCGISRTGRRRRINPNRGGRNVCLGRRARPCIRKPVRSDERGQRTRAGALPHQGRSREPFGRYFRPSGRSGLFGHLCRCNTAFATDGSAQTRKLLILPPVPGPRPRDRAVARLCDGLHQSQTFGAPRSRPAPGCGEQDRRSNCGRKTSGALDERAAPHRAAAANILQMPRWRAHALSTLFCTKPWFSWR